MRTKVCLGLLIVFNLVLSGLVLGSQLTTFSRSFDVSGTAGLVVNVTGGDILVNPGGGVRGIQVDVVGLDQQDLEYLEVRQEGNTVYVDFRPRGQRASRNLRFEFTVSEDAQLDLNTAGGDISITGAVKGDVKGKTAGGDITMKDVDGTVSMKTAGGNIEAGVVRGNCELATSGGDVRLVAADGEVQVKTSGGDIQVGDIGQKLDASTAGGDITLGNVGGAAVVKTAGGDIEVGSVDGSAELKTAGGDILLSAARGAVTAKTAGGDMELKQVEGRIEGATAGGDIVAEMLAAGDGSSSLTTAGGNIDLRVAGGLGITVRAVIHIEGNWTRESQRFGIYSDLANVQVIRDEVNQELRADIPLNGGGPEVFLETSNGNIRIDGLR